MKNYALLCIGIFCLSLTTKAQEVNWRSSNLAAKNLIALHLGADYGTALGLDYGRLLPGKIPVILGLALAVPFGHQLVDDWKGQINGQGELWHNDPFSVGLKPGIGIRKYQSEAARLYNLGADLTTTFGYFRRKWAIAGEVNYDKPLFTHITHGILKEYYPGIRDGWYSSTGGNFKFGVKANYTLGKWGIFLKAGKLYGQNFKDNPTLPFFFDLSLSRYF